MHRETFARIAMMGCACLAPLAGAAPAVEAPAEIGTLERVETSPPLALPQRRRQAVTLDTPIDAGSGPAMMSRMRHAFLAMDADGNGAIDRRERAAARVLFMFDFQLADADDDERVSRAEHREWSRRQLQAR